MLGTLLRNLCYVTLGNIIRQVVNPIRSGILRSRKLLYQSSPYHAWKKWTLLGVIRGHY